MKNNTINDILILENFYQISQRTLREALRPLRENNGVTYG
jgi:hypothetical protein